MSIPNRVWPCLNYRDARAALAFLTDAFGFEPTIVEPPEGDVVAHSELRLPNGAGVMVGSAGVGDEVFASLPAGGGNVYIVVDDPEPVHATAVAAGADIVRELRHEDFGSYGFSARDPEGNVWSFGTYAGT